MNNEQSIQHLHQPLLSTIEGVKKVYFIGIGGIGMSAIARYFKAKGN